MKALTQNVAPSAEVPSSLASIIRDFMLGGTGGTPPYGDFNNDQAMIQKGIDYYIAECHKRLPGN